ncbi:hypothetical protein ACV242_000515 [Peribacillus simplex]
MGLYTEITIALLIIATLLLIIHIVVIQRLKKANIVNEGLEIGNSIPSVVLEDFSGKQFKFDSSKSEDNQLLIILDLDCKECNKMFKSLDVYNQLYLKNVKLVFLKSEFNLLEITKSAYKNHSFFLEKEVILNQFKISSFPFYLNLDKKGTVLDRGYISKNNLIDFIS